MRNYKTARNPNDGLWYVVGYCGQSKAGRGQWVPVSSGFKLKTDAIKHIGHQAKADVSARCELQAV